MNISGYPVTWSGKPDPEDKSGIATWMVEGEKYEFQLERFEDCQKIDHMLSEAHKSARACGAFKIYDAVTDAANRMAIEAGVPPEWMKKQEPKP